MLAKSILMATGSPIPLAVAGCLERPRQLMIDGRPVRDIGDPSAIADLISGGESLELKTGRKPHGR